MQIGGRLTQRAGRQVSDEAGWQVDVARVDEETQWGRGHIEEH